MELKCVAQTFVFRESVYVLSGLEVVVGGQANWEVEIALSLPDFSQAF